MIGQLVGDELGATGVTHGPHLGCVQVVLAHEGLREGTEELTIGVHIFPPGDAVTGCVGVRGNDRHKHHVAGVRDLAHCREHALVGGVDLGLVTLPVVTVDHANGLGVVQVVRVHVVLRGGAGRGGVALVGCGAHGAGTLGALLLLFGLLLSLLLDIGGGGCLTLGERVAQDLGEVVVEVARAVQNGCGGVGVAGVAVGVVAALNGAAGAPGLRVGLAGAVVRVCVPEHGLGLQRCGGGALIQATAGDHDGAATIAPGLGLSVQLVGDEFGTTRVAHGPHVGGVHAVSRVEVEDHANGLGEVHTLSVHVVLRGGARRGGVGQESLVGAGCGNGAAGNGGLCRLSGLGVSNLRESRLGDHGSGLGSLCRRGSLRGLRRLEGCGSGLLGLCCLSCLCGVGLLDGLDLVGCGSFSLLANLHSHLRKSRLGGRGKERALGCAAGDVLYDGSERGCGRQQGATEHGGNGNSRERACLNGAGAKCHGGVLVVGVSGA